MSRWTTGALLGVWLASSGCFARSIIDVQSAAEASGTTLLTTIDQKNYVLFGNVKKIFWECVDDGNSLDCRQACDVVSDDNKKLRCPTQNFTIFDLIAQQ